jgi:hypothetical protein
MKSFFISILLLILSLRSFCWGFYGHQKINYLAVFLLPPEMLPFYKTHIDFIAAHSVDPDKRRYALKEEGPRHYIDIDHYGAYPYQNLPRNYQEAAACYSEDTLMAHGIVPWWVQRMLFRLTKAFQEKDANRILKISAEIGHYISDAHVPLHACHNHNGQYTGQHGIHGFWESRVPELLADAQFNFWIGRAVYLQNPEQFIWNRVLESAAAADTVLQTEKELTASFPKDYKYAFENRNGIIIRQYAAAFTVAYHQQLHGMVERRMRESIFAVSSYWYTAWVNAGQPDLNSLLKKEWTEEDHKNFEELEQHWKNGKIVGRDCN